jgi:PQQ-like domain/NHL repeat
LTASRPIKPRRVGALLLSFGVALLLAAPAASASSFAFAGSVNATGTAFRSHTFPVTEASTITVTLDWDNAGADLNLFLYRPGGTFVAGTGGSSAKPEVLVHETGITGTWKVGVKAQSGSAGYSVVANVEPAGGGGPVAPAYLRTIGGPGHAGMYPSGLDVAPSGTVFVADTGNSQVAAYTPGGMQLWRVGTRGSGSTAKYLYPRDLAFLNGTIYVGDTGNGRVVPLDAATGAPIGPAWTGFTGLMGVSAGVDAAGGDVILVTEDQRNRVQVRSPSGTIIRTVGTGPGSGNGQLRYPRDAATDADGNIYVADFANNRVVKFGPAGGFIANWTNAGGSAFNRPYGADVDDAGFVYIADSNNNRIEKLTSTGMFVRSWGSIGTGDGQFTHLRRVAVGPGPDPSVYGADLWFFRILRFDQAGPQLNSIPAVVTSPPPGGFNEPSGLAVDSDVFVVDALNQRLHRFSLTGSLETTWAHRGWNLDLSGVNWPRDIAIDSVAGTVWVADSRNHRLLEFNRDGAPTGRSLGTGNPGNGALQFHWPEGIAAVAGDLIVADTFNDRVQRIDLAGPSVVWTATGLRRPEDVAVSGSAVFVADGANHRIVKLDLGSGATSSTFGSSNLHYAGGVAVDALGRVWASDSTWSRLIEFSAAGVMRQVFGSSGTGHGRFTYPTKVAIAGGLLYVADQWSDRVEVFQLG